MPEAQSFSFTIEKLRDQCDGNLSKLCTKNFYLWGRGVQKSKNVST